MELSKEQDAAVRCGSGPVLVLAGPGSGKTTVITHRIRYLIDEMDVDPRNILVVTFTKAAANEMRQRFFSMEGRKLPVSFCTFHAAFFAILRSVCHLTAANIVSESQRYECIKGIIQEMQLEFDDFTEFSTSLLTEIANAKESMSGIENYYATACGADEFREVYRRYNTWLRDNRLIDFEDMMLLTRRLFHERPAVLAAWQDKFRWILVDEFQDINPMQYMLIRQLAAPQDNLFVVGDDDQSIYGFRGANPRIMLNFRKDYRKAKIVRLSVNYRCLGNIVAGASRVIGHNKSRFSKNIRASRERGPKLIVKAFKDTAAESNAMLAEVRRMHDCGVPYSDMAVLLRTNTQARPYVEKFMSCNIPFSVQDNVPNLYQHWISRDILSYIAIAAGSRARSDFLRVINRPNRYVSRAAFPETMVDIGQIYAFYEDKDWMCRRLDKFVHDIRVISSLRPQSAVEYVRHGIGYDQYLEDYAAGRGIEAQDLMETAAELSESAAGFRTNREWLEHIAQFNARLKEENRGSRFSARAGIEAGAARDEEKDCVSLATVHHSKGLEYRYVYIVDANEGTFPYRKAKSADAIEEERRMFYVAMTRAQDGLSIYYVKEHNGRSRTRSRFVDELLGYSKEKDG